MEIKYISIEEIKPYKNNPRKISEANISIVAKSINNFGFKVPIVIDRDNVIVTGHTRYEASKKLGLEKVPCIIADDLTPKQIKEFRLVDNKTSELSSWDFDKLDIELGEIELDMSEFGFEVNRVEESYINDIMENGFSNVGKNSESEYFNLSFTIDKGYKNDFDEYIKNNGKEALKNLLISEVSAVA